MTCRRRPRNRRPPRNRCPPAEPAPKGAYTVQVAAVATEAEARSETEALKKKGFDAYYRKIEHQGKHFYRVRVGHLATRDDAHALMKKLSAAGQRDMFAHPHR